MNISKEILDEMLNEGPRWDKTREHVKKLAVLAGIIGAGGGVSYAQHAVNADFALRNAKHLGYFPDATSISDIINALSKIVDKSRELVTELPKMWKSEPIFNNPQELANSKWVFNKAVEQINRVQPDLERAIELQKEASRIPWEHGSLLAISLYLAFGLINGLRLSKKINTMYNEANHINDPIKKLQLRIQLLTLSKNIHIKALDKIKDQNKKNKAQNIIKKYQEDINKLSNKLSKMTHKESVELQERMNPITTSLANMIAWPVFNIIFRKKLENMYYHCNNLEKSEKIQCQLQLLNVLHVALKKEYEKDKGNYNLYNKMISVEKRIKELKEKKS